MKNDLSRFMVSPEIKRKMVETARRFRKAPTKSEALLWQALPGKKLDGIKFRRQQFIGYFVEGSVHDDQVEFDRARQDILEELGLRVFRVKAEFMEMNVPLVLGEIRKKVNEIKLDANVFPSPIIGEGLGERDDSR